MCKGYVLHFVVSGYGGDRNSVPTAALLIGHARSPIPTAESRAAVGTEFLSPYPPPYPYPWDPHTHGRPAD